MTLLVVDDAEWLGITLEIALPGATVALAKDGQHAWSLLERQTVAAIVTDLHMPGMDGFRLIERVRSNAATATIPIVVVSADSSVDAQERAERLGANAYFVKPCSPSAVRGRLEELLDANLLRDSD